jgi:transcriptional regulator with XRE-family HTH domain
VATLKDVLGARSLVAAFDALTPTQLVSENLRKLRQAARLSQSEMLKRLDELGAPMDQAALSRKESGKRPITLDELFRFAAVLDVNPAVLLVPQEPRGEVALTPSAFEASTRIRSWIRARGRLERFSGLESAGYRLRDQELEDEARSLAQESIEATVASETQAERLKGAEAILEKLEAQPFLNVDRVGDAQLEAARAAVRAEERNLVAAMGRERQLHERMDELRAINAEEGWIEPDYFDELLNEPGSPGVRLTAELR